VAIKEMALVAGVRAAATGVAPPRGDAFERAPLWKREGFGKTGSLA
jgi:hypothetical protein